MKKNPTHNPENERIKRRYFEHLKEARGYSEATVDEVAHALARFEDQTHFRTFKSFHIEQAKAFKRHLAQQQNHRTKEVLSAATRHQILASCKAFFQWLAREPGYRSKVSYSDAEYFNLNDKEVAVAKAERQRPVPTVEQILHVLRSNACDHRHPAAGPGSDCLYAAHWGTRRSDRFDETEACRCGEGPRGPRCARREDEIL